MKYRYRIPEPGTTISGFADNKKKINPDRPTLDFFWHVTVNTHIFFFGLLIKKLIITTKLTIPLDSRHQTPNKWNEIIPTLFSQSTDP